MSSIDQPEARPNPWFSVWYRPRRTIRAIVATDPRRHVLLLGALTGIGSVLSGFVGADLADDLFDWRGAGALVAGGAALGTVRLYVSPALYRMLGRMFGGAASQVELRAAVAWGGIPVVWGVLASIVLLIGVKIYAASVSEPLSAFPVAAVVTLLLFVSSLAELIIILLMLAEVQNFGFWLAAVSWLLILLGAAAIALMVRTFLFQPFTIPTQSMSPNLIIGDLVFASKMSYGFGRYSAPFDVGPAHGRLVASEPTYGDVAVYALPSDPNID